jgi:hypothetical protein
LQDGVFKTPLKEVVAVDCGCDHFYALAQILFAGGGDPPLKLLLDLGEAGNEIVSPLTFVVAFICHNTAGLSDAEQLAGICTAHRRALGSRSVFIDSNLFKDPRHDGSTHNFACCRARDSGERWYHRCSIGSDHLRGG